LSLANAVGCSVDIIISITTVFCLAIAIDISVGGVVVHINIEYRAFWF
jgi:hypothetical protein